MAAGRAGSMPVGGDYFPCELYNCTLTGNSASVSGGGACYSSLNNSILYYNTAPSDSGPNSSLSVLNYCCTTPMPAWGAGNITNAPLFVDYAGGNLRLQSNSPCINAADNASVANTIDLDGRPRIVGGTVDMGAYEFQGPGMGEFIAWLQQFGLPTDGSADFSDPDADLLNTFQEWTADTDPTNAASVLRITAISPGPRVSVSLQSSAARLYTLESCPDLSTGPWTPVSGQTDVPGTGGLLTLSGATTSPSRFYRVSVRMP